MIIYGTNLGTIVIRIILAAGLRGSAQRLVRFEDFFCLVSGVLMVAALLRGKMVPRSPG